MVLFENQTHPLLKIYYFELDGQEIIQSKSWYSFILHQINNTVLLIWCSILHQTVVLKYYYHAHQEISKKGVCKFRKGLMSQQSPNQETKNRLFVLGWTILLILLLTYFPKVSLLLEQRYFRKTFKELQMGKPMIEQSEPIQVWQPFINDFLGHLVKVKTL